MRLNNWQRRSGILLVQVGACFALIDRAAERVFMMNAAGAWVWTRLGLDAEVPAPSKAILSFIHELDQQDLLGPACSIEELEPAGNLREPPALLGKAPLQIAANASGGILPFLPW